MHAYHRHSRVIVTLAADDRDAAVVQSVGMASSSEDFEDLYGEERDIIKAPVRPAEKLVEYVLPSTGEKMSVHVVGHHVLWVGPCG